MSKNVCFTIKHYRNYPKMLSEGDIAMGTDHMTKAPFSAFFALKISQTMQQTATKTIGK